MPTIRLAGTFAGLWLLASCGDAQGQAVNCESDPPCELSGTTEIAMPLTPLTSEYEVSITVGEQFAAFECTVLPAEAVAMCAEVTREGLDDWLVDVRVDGPAGALGAVVLELDRAMDESPGPDSIQLQVRSDNGFFTRIITPTRRVVSTDGRSCEQCRYELPDTLGM